MEAERYYYSVDGSVVRGPVTVDAMRRLCEQRILDATSLVCPEGDKAWRKLDPTSFAPSTAHVPRQLSSADRLRAKGIRTTRVERKSPADGIGRVNFAVAYLFLVGFSVYLQPFGPAIHDRDSLLLRVGIEFVAGIAQLILLALRLEDVGYSRWYCLFAFVPFANFGLIIYGFYAASNSRRPHSSLLMPLLLGAVVSFLFTAALLVWYMLRFTPH